MRWFLLVILLGGVLLARESRRPGPLATLDTAFFDWLSANTPPAAASARGHVTLVEIDDSVAAAPDRLPLSPLDYALFLQAVEKYDPAVVAIEPILDWPHVLPGNEQLLIEQALAVPKLLFAATLGTAQDARSVAALPKLDDVQGDASALENFPEVVAAPEGHLLPVGVCGITNLPPATAGPVRAVPLIFRWRDQVLPSFTLEALMLWLKVAPSEVSAVLGSHIRVGDQLRIPIDAAGNALLDPGVFRRVNHLNLDDLMVLAGGQAAPAPAAATAARRIKSGIVILGRTDRAAANIDLPVGRIGSPAELFAMSVASLEQRAFVRRASGWWDAGIIVAVALLGWRLLRATRRKAIYLSLGAVAVYFLAALSVFQASGLWLPLALPLGLTALTCVLLWVMQEGRRPTG